MKNSLEKRIIYFAFIILFLTILANTGIDILGFRQDYIQALILRSQNIGTSLKGSIEKVLSLGLDVRDIDGLTVKCREVVQSNPEVAFSIITDSEGKVLFLSDPKFAALRLDIIKKSFTIKFDQNIHLVGEGPRYYNTVTPVRSPEGKQVALINIGFSEDIITSKVMRMVLHSLLVLIIFFLISFSLVVLFVKKSIIQPISQLLGGVNQIAAGVYDTQIPELPVYEFNELAKNINLMSETIRSRELEVQRGYQDLEHIHHDLNSSYLKLETLSLELEKSEELYKSLLEDASDAIIVIDNNEIVKMANKMSEEFFGYPATRLVGLTLTKMLMMLKTENVPLVYNIFQEAVKGKHVAEEFRFLRNDSEQVVGRIHASRITIGDEILFQAIVRDVTREREILLNLEKSAADLARLNRMKDSFLGIASHEIKTPLTVIMGYSELILSDMTEKADKSVLEMVQNMANAASRLDSIVKDMVDVSMIDEKKVQLNLQPVNVNDLVESAINELNFFFSMRKQSLSFKLDDALPSIKGDPIRLMQLLSNVLGNAIKFTPDGGTISVTTRSKYLLRSRQSPSLHPVQTIVNIGKEQHHYVEILVEDEGIGIDVEEQLRIFDKFYEVGNIEEHSSGKVAFKSKGAGLGLAIAKGIVEMHGGEIWVESAGCNPDQFPGSTFHILLPLNPIVGDGTIDYLNLLK